ncbi:CHRD domain-containing protein [Pseudanabaena sp. FACHB-2040]|uniref:CHRD domain-containing protein n=1 Tax=Pseudanabaena sp. FACHB-2040 TaxID=2692859 RepID=UPI001686F356|nr:CHRD domain-containing protein [Pseudanabaena sp. FACHB-2040]MBD2258433.1 CHRD domain-containing protein [Pseudanabaena sp. FACHB-2040]
MIKTGLAAALVAGATAVLLPMTAEAASFAYTTQLRGSNEVPPNASPATGMATGSLLGDPDNWEFTYSLDFADLSAELILAHIHVAAMPMGLPPTQQTGPVVHDLDSPPLGATSGSIVGNWTSDEVVAAGVDPTVVYERFLAGQYYFNLHSNTPEFAAPGEIRGQIEFDDAAAVPEPAAVLGLLAVGAVGFGATRKKQIA